MATHEKPRQMDLWVRSVFEVDNYKVHLGENYITIASDSLHGGRSLAVTLQPIDRGQAIRLSIALRKAARRLEMIGNDVLGEGR